MLMRRFPDLNVYGAVLELTIEIQSLHLEVSKITYRGSLKFICDVPHPRVGWISYVQNYSCYLPKGRIDK